MDFLKILIKYLPSPAETLDAILDGWGKKPDKKKHERKLEKYGYWIPILKPEYGKTKFFINNFEGRRLDVAPESFQDIPEGEGLVVIRYFEGKESARFAHTEEALRTLTTHEPLATKNFILFKAAILCDLTGHNQRDYENEQSKYLQKIIPQKTPQGRGERSAAWDDGERRENWAANDLEIWRDIDPDVYGYPLLNRKGGPKFFTADYLEEKHSGILLKKPPPSFLKIPTGQALILILEKNHTDNARFAHTSRAFDNLVKSPGDSLCGQSTYKKYVYLDYPEACKMAKFPPPPQLNPIKPKKKHKPKAKGS